MRAIDWLALFALALLWGTSFLFMELAIPSFAAFTLVFIRVSIALMLSWLLLLWRQRRPWQIIMQRWRSYAVLGFLGSAFPFLCFSWGQRYIESGLASVLNALVPLFVLLLALLVGREKYSFIRIFGIMLGFVGVGVLVQPEGVGMEWRGIVAALLAVVSYATATNYAWGRMSHHAPQENACGQLFFASLYMLPFTIYEQPWTATFFPTAVVAIIGLGVFSTFLAYLVYYFLLSNAGGVNAMLAVLLIPPIAVSLGVVFLEEKFDYLFFIGAALIIAGVICADEKLRCFLRQQLAQLGRTN